MDIFTLKIHESADVFPMLPKDELEELAADIKANGLIHPLVVKDDILIDGRNRRAACEIAGVVPEVVELNGQDPDAYIISSNINRRHMTKGQKAMAVAMIYPEAQKYKAGGTDCLEIKQLNKSYLSQARAVLKHLPDTAQGVLAGSMPLGKAYDEATEARDAAKTEEEKLHELQSIAPELAENVIQGDIELEDAIVEHERQVEQARIDRLGWWKILKDLDTNRMVLNESSIDEIAQAYSQYASEAGIDITELSDWYGEVFESLLEKINEYSNS